MLTALQQHKVGLIKESILTSVPLLRKGAKFTPLSRKFEYLSCLLLRAGNSRDLTPFVGNGTKVKILSEIKPPSAVTLSKRMPIIGSAEKRAHYKLV